MGVPFVRENRTIRTVCGGRTIRRPSRVSLRRDRTPVHNRGRYIPARRAGRYRGASACRFVPSAHPALSRRKEFERTFRHDIDGAFSGRAVRGDENPFVQSDDHTRLPAEQYDPRLAFCGFRTEEHGFDL